GEDKETPLLALTPLLLGLSMVVGLTVWLWQKFVSKNISRPSPLSAMDQIINSEEEWLVTSTGAEAQAAFLEAHPKQTTLNANLPLVDQHPGNVEISDILEPRNLIFTTLFFRHTEIVVYEMIPKACETFIQELGKIAKAGEPIH